VIPRALVAFFGTLTLSFVFASSVGHLEYLALAWPLTFGYAFVVWAWAPPPSGSPVERAWWFVKTAGQSLWWFAVWLAVVYGVFLMLAFFLGPN
jgi:hypothetical protein